MKLSDFSYELPKELIAQCPTEQRTGSRLLCLQRDSGEIKDMQFTNLIDYLEPNDCLVMNNTRVIPARIHAQKETGGKIEILVERVIDDKTILAQIRASKSPKADSEIIINQQYRFRVIEKIDSFYRLLSLSNESIFTVLDEVGHMPLPPYITRDDDQTDLERYQTVYASEPGAVAAPTAGLHFDDALLDKIKAKGINIEYVTLHVGAGTFQPVRCDNIAEHKMHKEWVEVTAALVEKIKDTKAKGGRVVAIGTTTVRCLESAALSGELQPFLGDTDIFITPGSSFRVIDALLTNFHLPESTLIMLVSAFAGYTETMNAYEHAVAEQYRFFSYGDAMFIS